MCRYEEVRIPKGDYAKYLKEGMECMVLSWNDRVIGVDPPQVVELMITQTDPGPRPNHNSTYDPNQP